jgi:hypothetical protein
MVKSFIVDSSRRTSLNEGEGPREKEKSKRASVDLD